MPSKLARSPGDDEVARARLTIFQAWLKDQRGLSFPDYESLWQWSTTDLDGFWDAIRDYFNIQLHGTWSCVLTTRQMPGARWFPGSRLNYVEHVFRHRTRVRPAIVFGREDGSKQEVSWEKLECDVGALARFLRERGVVAGDRVVAYLPNLPETIVAFLAVASVGAVWSLCSPDLGPASVLDRFRQIEPRVLITVDGYVNAGRTYDRTADIARLVSELPTVHTVVWIPTLGSPPTDLTHARPHARTVAWSSAIEQPAAIDPVRVDFDHPLWILYSSGTTGMPKGIVHGHGGIVFEHLKTTLHTNLGPEDRTFWYTSAGWMMWNVQVSALLIGSTVIVFDGSPAGPDAARPDLSTLWRFASAAGATFFGAGAAYFTACLKAGVEPTRVADLARLRCIGSTGSPLSPETEEWIYADVGNHVRVAPGSGGTDIASGFVGGLPTVPSYLGEMQGRCLGARVEAWSDSGTAVIDEVGELVVTAPMPSMPIYFWNDPGNARYRDSYFDMFPGVWRHGDWLRIVPHPAAFGCVIYGRSDATINRHGIRMGTAELYRAVEVLAEVQDSLVVDLEYLGRESYMPLFVVLRPSCVLDEALKSRFNDAVRKQLSPRHVPTEIFEVPDIPRTLTGKKLELPIKRMIMGQPIEKVLNRDAMGNPESIHWFIEFAKRHLERKGL